MANKKIIHLDDILLHSDILEYNIIADPNACARKYLIALSYS
jgi:hypothetical protein